MDIQRIQRQIQLLREELAYYIGRGDWASVAEVEEDLKAALRSLKVARVGGKK